MKGFVFKFLLPIAIIGAFVYFGFKLVAPPAIVVVPTKGVAPKTVPGNVKVMAEKRSELKSDVSGRIIASHLELGKIVEAGDVLIQLDRSDINLQIERAKLDLEGAQELAAQESPAARSLEAAEQRLEAASLDFERGFQSEQQMDALRAEVKVREDALERDKNNKARDIKKHENELKRLELQRSRMTLKSPITGIVYHIGSYEGDLIGQGQTIAYIASLVTLVEARVSEENFADLEVGQPARVNFLGFGNEAFDATIERLIPVADDTTQRYSILLDVDIDDSRLSHGLTGATSITVDEHENALLIPKKAVNGNSVFVVSNGKAEIRELVLGYSSLTYVEVLEGLSEDDTIIVENLSLFRDGQVVRPQLIENGL